MKLENPADITLKPFGLKDKIGYMMGDLGNDFFFIMASSFLTIFYTNVLGINGAIVGTLFLVARCVDAFTDIGMGQIVDRAVAHADGRYRVWIKRMMIPVVCSGVLMFVPWVATWAMPLRIAYIFVTYILWGSFMYTSINIPYGSMAAVLTDDPVHRSALSTFRSLGAAFAGAIVGSLTSLIIYDKLPDGTQVMNGSKVFMVACVFALLALCCYYLCYKWSNERIVVEQEEGKKQSVKELLSALFSNRALVSIIAAAILLLLSMLLTQSFNMYLFQDYFKDITAMSAVGLLSTACTLILAPFSGTLTKKFGKKESAAVGLIFSSIIFGIMFVLKINNPWVFVGFLLFANMGSGLFNLMIWAFITDIIDYQTFKTGHNDGGTIYGVYSFSRKIGQALAGGLGGFVLSWIGYQSSVAGTVVTQTPAVLNSIYTVVTLVPAVCYLLIALILIFWYPLSKKKVIEIKDALNERAGKNA